MIIWSIDKFEWNIISGWAYSNTYNNLKIDFFYDNNLIGYCFANKFRNDLISVGDSEGFISFSYNIDPKFRYKKIYVVIKDKKILPKWKVTNGRNKKILKYYKDDMKSLEIGALDNPILSTKNSNVIFSDHLSLENLKKKYQQKKISSKLDYDSFAPVDYKLDKILNSNNSFKFDYIVGSHFLEHHPNPIYFLKKASCHLNINGYIALALPDKRFTFDKFNKSSSFQDWVNLYISNAKKPQFSNIYNSLLIKYKNLNMANFDRKAFKEAKDIIDSGIYFDCHVSYFTKKEFINIMNLLYINKVIDLSVIKIFNNYANSEFIVIFQKKSNNNQDYR
jgi:predicted SAM-dependent methyltransferase